MLPIFCDVLWNFYGVKVAMHLKDCATETTIEKMCTILEKVPGRVLFSQPSVFSV